jgi:hypothetical protein
MAEGVVRRETETRRRGHGCPGNQAPDMDVRGHQLSWWYLDRTTLPSFDRLRMAGLCYVLPTLNSHPVTRCLSPV